MQIHPSVTSIAIACTAALPLAAADTAAAAPSHQCKSFVRRVAQADGAPKALEAATEVSIRGGSCATTRSVIGGMILQVAASRNLAPTSPNYYADDRDYLTKRGWKVAHLSGDPATNTGARWHIYKGNASLRFTRWR